MTKTRTINIRVSQTQLARIKSNASLKGYRYLSRYLRAAALGEDEQVRLKKTNRFKRNPISPPIEHSRRFA
ncbi:MAG: hypothetical protein GC154_20310 [bacterium]|nr:hypothetical protein [bacterium]